MARYDIYGVGGALVDTEVEVSDKFLMFSFETLTFLQKSHVSSTFCSFSFETFAFPTEKSRLWDFFGVFP